MELPDRLPLAHTPTPLQPMARLSEVTGLDLRVKRDDLTGSHLSGNKVRKLEFHLAAAQAAGATHVVTCGGVQSNHCRATALAAAPLGLQPVLLLKTERGLEADLPEPPTGNVLLDRLAGATLHTCDPSAYETDRDRLCAELAREVRSRGGTPWVVPEGGSDALGMLGYVEAAREIASQAASEPPETVVVPTGSGGTVAGLAAGLRAAGLRSRTLGLVVQDDPEPFPARIRAMLDEAGARWSIPVPGDDAFEARGGYQGRGYARSSPEELDLLAQTARRDGLVLDPVYTVKALRGLLDLARTQPHRLGPRVVFVHTGGVFGLLGAAEALAPHL